MSVLDSFSSPSDRMRMLELHSPIAMPSVPEPQEEVGVFTGLAGAIPRGIEHAHDIAMMAGLKALEAPVTAVFEDISPETNIKQWFKEATDERIADLRESRPDAKTMGMAAQGVQQLTTVLAAGVAGAITPVPGGAAMAIGAATGMDKYWELRDQNVDHDTALKGAGITGTVMGVGTALAPYYGQKLASQLTSAVGINVGLGVAERGGIGEVLKADGYDKVAEHYKMLDATSVGVDAILGMGMVGFGRFANRSRIPQEEVDAAMTANKGIQQRIGTGELPTTLEGLDAQTQRQVDFTEQVLSGGSIRDIVIDPPPVESVPNPRLATEAELGVKVLNDSMVETQGRTLPDVVTEFRNADEAFKEVDDAIQKRSAEEVDVRQRAEDGEAVAARAAQEETAGTRQAEEEVVQTKEQEAGVPVSEKVLELEQKYAEAKGKLDAIGDEPRKPSSEKAYFGQRGREGADPEVVAKYDADVKAYKSWRSKYTKLKKAEVEASNQLFYARKEVEAQQPKLGAGDTATKQVDVETRQAEAKKTADTIKPEDITQATARAAAKDDPVATQMLDEAEAQFRQDEMEASLHNVAIQCLLGHGGIQ